MTAEPSTATTRPRSTLTRYRLLAIGVAVASGIVVWIIAALAGARLAVTSPLVGTIGIGLPLVVVTSIAVGFAAWGVLAVLERMVRNARRAWTTIAVVILLISLLSVLVIDATTGTRVALGFLHLAVGLPLTLMLPRGARTSLPG